MSGNDLFLNSTMLKRGAAVESFETESLRILRRSQLTFVVISLVPTAVLVYLAEVYVIPSLVSQGKEQIGYGITAVLVLSALISVLGYIVTRRDTMALIDRLQRSRDQFGRLLLATEKLSTLKHSDEIASELAVQAARSIGAHHAMVWLSDEGERLKLSAFAGKRSSEVAVSVAPGEALAGRVFKNSRPALNEPMTQKDREICQSLDVHALHSIAAPLTFQGEVRGVLTVHDRRDGKAFTDADLALLCALAPHATSAFQQAESQGELRNYFTHVTRLLSQLIERELLWSNHIYNVDRISSLIAQKLGFSEAERRDLHFACILHDIGLSKPLSTKSALSPEQLWDHPSRGQELVLPITLWKGCAPIIQSHHEYMDGSGYPHKLKGEQIPLGARVLGVAEWWDEQLNPASPFNHNNDVESVLKTLRRQSGRRFDPTVVKAFEEVMQQNA